MSTAPRLLLGLASVAVAFAAADTYVVVLALPEMMNAVGVPIDLPETQAKAMNSETQPITISVNEGGQVYLQETEIPLAEVVAKLTAIAAAGYEERIYVRGDRTADYGTVMQVMARISAAGYRNIGLVTLQEQDDI